MAEDIPDAFPPILEKKWSEAPHLPDKVIKTESGDKEPTEPVAHQAWSVHPGSLRECENGLLGELPEQIRLYQELREYVQANKDSVFKAREPPGWVKIAFAMGDAYQEIEWSKLKEMDNNYGQLIGATNEESAEYGDMMEQALVATANSIYLVGELIQLLNEAAQGYVSADITCTMPAPPTVKTL